MKREYGLINGESLISTKQGEELQADLKACNTIILKDLINDELEACDEVWHGCYKTDADNFYLQNQFVASGYNQETLAILKAEQ